MVARKQAQRSILLAAMVSSMREAMAKPEYGTWRSSTDARQRGLLLLAGWQTAPGKWVVAGRLHGLTWSHSGDSTVARKTNRKERESSQCARMAARASGLASASHPSAISTLSCSPGAELYLARSLTAASLPTEAIPTRQHQVRASRTDQSAAASDPT